MRISEIDIERFRIWRSLLLRLDTNGPNVTYGPNEAGKTTLMNFLRTIFYGFTPDRRTRYLPPVYGGKPGGALRVTGPGGGYEICRRAQLDQNGPGGSLTVTGNDGIVQGGHRLAMLLGQVDESIFTNVFAIGLRELQELSTLDDTAAADELYKLSSGLDRVSLVDVTRQLKAARQTVVGPTPDKGQMQHLMQQREKLKDEIDALSANGHRWGELAALRKTQNLELVELKERIERWELEAKTYEVAIQVRPTWKQRSDVIAKMHALHARTDIPDSAAERLEALNEKRQMREGQMDEVREQRSALRQKARELPLKRGILDLANKIDAATEQIPWVGALQKNIQRLDHQIDTTRRQLVEDAKRLGLSDDDRMALLNDQEMNSLPDLSRQAINSLAEPASEVRIWTSRLRQAKDRASSEEKDLLRLEQELKESMQITRGEEIEKAMERHADSVSLLRKRIQVQETLDKQIARREQLEEEAIDLQCDEALPVERSLLLGVLFVGGAFLFLWGLSTLLPFFGSASAGDTQNGLLFVVCGMFMLFFGLMWSNNLDRSTVSNLEDVEDQIDAIRKDVRKTENERDDIERRLPPYTGSLETRLKEVQREIESLEELLPIQHNHAAAKERFLAAKKRVAQAADALKSAKLNWQRVLRQMGLSESLSPKSIRVMAEGYDSLLQTRRRLNSLEEENDQRKIELGAITQRIDTLSRSAFAIESQIATTTEQRLAKSSDDEEHDAVDLDEHVSTDIDFDAATLVTDTKPRPNVTKVAHRTVKADAADANHALEQLSKLQSLLASQEQFIQQRKALKARDQHLAKQADAIQKVIDKIDRSIHALLNEYACESEEHLLEALEIRHQHEELLAEIGEFDDRIQAMIGGMIPYETVERMLTSAEADDLEQRWTAIGQRTQQAEERVEQLQLRQGELNQEMKSLAANNRLAEARLEYTCIENQLKSCAQHWRTLAVTTGLLDRVCEVYEAERQPETLREASAFLKQLSEGKYVRIWTPLGKNQLRIDSAQGQSLPLEVLSRGTREAVFIALRLSLAAAYARRGVTIPLVLDDVLVNFDSVRADSAAKVLRDFADLGHQVVMFTCHEHIMRIFHDIGVQVRVLPQQGKAGEAEVYYPQMFDVAETPVIEPAPEIVETEFVPELVFEDTTPEPVAPKEVHLPILEINPPATKPKRNVRRLVVVDHEPEVDWLWYERNPDSVDWGWVEAEERVDEKSLPADLWWDHHRRETQIKDAS